MNINRFFILISLFFILILSISVISAGDNSNDTSLSGSENDLKNDNGNVIIVEPDKENPNQIVKPTIQPAIDEASPGDTLILSGNFAHCHFLINKNSKLFIK